MPKIVQSAGLFVAFMTALMASSAPASAQGRIVDRHGDWQIRCEQPVGAPAEQCALVQNVEAEDRANVGLTVIFLRTADLQSRILRVLAPLGVLLPSGLGLSIDDTEVGLAGFVRCLPEGCVAEVELDEQLVSQFEAGSTATFVIFQTPEAGIGIPISLDGFSTGFAALDEPIPTDGTVDPPREVVSPPVTGGAQLPPTVAEASQQFDIPADDGTIIDQLLDSEFLPWVVAGFFGVLALIALVLVLAMRGGRRRNDPDDLSDFHDYDEDEEELIAVEDPAPRPARPLAPAPKRRQLPSSDSGARRAPPR